MLLGLAVPEVDRIGATQAIRARHPAVVVIVLSDSCLAHDVLEAIEAGAAGFQLKDLDPADLPQAVRAAAAGDTPLSRAAKALLAVRPQHSATEGLTPRGREVLVLLGEGLTNQGIARRLGIAETTVKGHLTSVFESIGVPDRLEAALWAQERSGWLDPADCESLSR